MDSRIGVGLIIGVVIGASALIWESRAFTHAQKIFLMACIVFPPLQWSSAILLYLYNTSIKDPLRLSNEKQRNDSFKSKSHEVHNDSLSITKNEPAQEKIKKSAPQKSKTKVSFEKQKSNLDELRRKGILSEMEYDDKINILNERVLESKVNDLPGYDELQGLLESELLTSEQFDLKVKKLKEKYREYVKKYGLTQLSEFTWKLYQVEKLNNKIEASNYSDTLLIGSWASKNESVSFSMESNTSVSGEIKTSRRVKIKRKNGLQRFGTWEFNNNKNTIIISLINTYIKDHTINYKIISLGSHILEYDNKGIKECLYKLDE